MKRFLLAGGAVAALCVGGAQAATVAYVPYTGGGSFYAPTTTDATDTQIGFTGSTGTSTSPFDDTTTPYDVVHANGSATFGANTGSGSFGSGSSTFSFLWGTPDNYNTLNFLSGSSIVATVMGSGDGSGSFIATVSGLPSFDHVQFESSRDAFEFAAISPVPLPTALPLFAGAVVALGVAGAVRRRKAAPLNA